MLDSIDGSVKDLVENELTLKEDELTLKVEEEELLITYIISHD